MANYFNLTLDTLSPSGVTVLINGDETKTNSTAAVLTIGCTDASTGGYQMKIWGTAAAPTEAEGVWESFQSTKNITLSATDGIKTVYVRLRDEVWNESGAASDTIALYTKAPSIVGLTFSTAKISLVNGKNTSAGSFGFDDPVDAVKIMVVESVSAAHDDPSNHSIPTSGGSNMYDDATGVPYNLTKLEYETSSPLDSMLVMNCCITGADLAAASPGDGAKIIKAFVRSSKSGLWSV